MKEEEKSTDSHRREFLKQMAIIGLVTTIAPFSWSCNEKKETLTFLGTGDGPYKVWEEMLMALKTSPDHLEGRYKNLIAGKDAKAMFDFVRDEIHLMPAKRADIHGMQTAMKYGTKGALRYGFATPREKAELLHEMYTKAGIKSTVVYEIVTIPDEEIPSFFYRPIERPFKPAIDDATRKRWAKELGEFSGKSKNYDLLKKTDAATAVKLADKLWEMLPDNEKIRPNKTSFLWDHYRNGTPTVEFELNGETKYAHLFDPKVPFGELKDKEKAAIKAAKPATYPDEKIRLTVSFRNGVDPAIEKELVSGEWPVHELVGNRIGVSFLDGLSLEEKMITPVGGLRTFTAGLSFQGFDLPVDYLEERSVLGNSFTLEGKVIDTSGESVKIDGYGIMEKPDKELQKKVTKLTINALPADFPLVKLEVTPTNAEGKLVEGLAAIDFSISDNKDPVKAILENNQRTPKVLILYDESLSMPAEYRGQGMEAFMDTLQKSILTKYPAARLEKWPTDSGLYTWLQKASQTNNDLIIFATDGDNNDTFDPKLERFYRKGPPAIILSVKGTSFESFDKMAELTNGLVIKAEEREQTTGMITSFLEKIAIAPYVFTYYASGSDLQHEVNLSIDNKRLSAAAQYTFQTKSNLNDPAVQKIAGLYLTIETGSKKIKRVLAGWSEYDKSPPTQKDFLDVRNTILGGALISIEGEGPTLSTALSDELKYKLSTRNWGEPLMRGEDEKAIEELKKGGYHYNTLFIPLMAPLEEGVTKNSYTYAAGPRIGILKQQPGINEKHSTLSFDYVPTSDYLSLDTDPVKAYKTTLQKTAELAILEDKWFPKSTLGLLKDKPLLELTTASRESWFRDNPAVEKDPAFWEGRLRLNNYGNKTSLYAPYTIFDKTASEKAYWQIAHDTGELYGILYDGTGGGAQSIESRLQDIDNVVEAYGKILDHLAQGLSGGLGLIAAYSKTLVKLYAIASVAIVIMDGSNVSKEVRRAMIELANDVAENIADL